MMTRLKERSTMNCNNEWWFYEFVAQGSNKGNILLLIVISYIDLNFLIHLEIDFDL
jgi:hypothetical protein